jgi:hypothetical protein
MSPNRRVKRGAWCLLGGGAAGYLGAVAFCFVGLGPDAPSGEPATWLGPTSARGSFPEGIDSDGDGMSDEFERFTDTNAHVADTDGDGSDDGAEWLLRSDPNDASSLPEPRPAIRSYAFESGGALRIFTLFFPAAPTLVDSFHLVAGSPDFVQAGEGDPGTGLGVIDLTDALPSLAAGYCSSDYLGLPLVGFEIDLDLSVMRSAPLVFGWAAQIAGVEAIDQLYLGIQGATPFVVAGGPTLPGGLPTFVAAPLQPIPPPNDEDSEYCEVAFSNGTPTGVATIEYTVTSAACEPDGLLYCIDADCTALANQTFLMLDYGYLQQKAAQ